MKVTEKDIFNFVFYPENVKEEIKAFLLSIEDFNDAIIFYKELKTELNKPVSDEVKSKLAEKIPAYSLNKIIHLYPVEEIKKKRNGYVLAAASVEEKPKIVTKTFYNDDKSYIIKIINYSENAKIFVFSTQQEVIKDFDLITLPENQKYHFIDNKLPLEISYPLNPESVQIEFSLMQV